MSMHNIWSKRFTHYISELQKYMQYIFTGHIAVVFVFVLGIVGYQYSEWLKTVDESFPVALVVGVIIGFVIALSRPTTLLREPDQVYLLPLESKMNHYFSKALKWTFFSQILLSVVLYIVSIPLLRAASSLTIKEIWLGVVVIVVLKALNVAIEFSYRYVGRGRYTFIDRLARIGLNIFVLYYFLQWELAISGIIALLIIAYYVIIQRNVYSDPIPYEHFISLEQNRMYRFYRFANYFTDVPHLRGSVKRRAWLDFVYRFIPYKRENAQRYLVLRTFIRTDDLFFLWVRLTAISVVFAAFIELQFVTWVISGALAFALVIQLKQALASTSEFRMDMLFPVDEQLRTSSINQLLIRLVVVQAIIVTLCNVMMPMFYITPIIIIVAGWLTIKLVK
jgi:ABC-2 type transport system permease protein